MSRREICGALALLLLLSSCPSTSFCQNAPELAKLLEKSDAGYIRLNDDLFRRAREGLREKAYSLFIFFDASDSPGVPRDLLGGLLRQFSAAAKSYEANRQKGKGEGSDERRVFFCVVDHADSPQAFEFFQLNSIPHVRFLSHGMDPKGSQCETGDLDGSSRSYLECLQDLSGVNVGPLPWGNLPWDALTLVGIVVVVGVIAFAGYRALSSAAGIFSVPPLVMLGCLASLAVYLFSISGMMHVIIHQMPLYHWTQDNPPKLMWMYSGEDQFGAEGIAAGLLYTFAGLALATLVNIGPHVKGRILQRFFALFCEGLCAAAVYGIFYYSKQKRGY